MIKVERYLSYEIRSKSNLQVQPFGTINTTRWFRLTTKKFAYYQDEAGEELG